MVQADSALFDKLSDELIDAGEAQPGTMMGFPCLKVKGSYFACKDKATGTLIVKLTENFSGRDLERLCTETVGRMVLTSNPGLVGLVRKGLEHVSAHTLKTRPLTRGDFQEAFKTVRIDPASLAAFQKTCKRFRDGSQE